jgi:thiamine biosynthesis lipoprotein
MGRREALRITAVAGIGLALTSGLVTALVRRGALNRVRITRTRMGTAVTVTVIHPDAAAARAMADAAFAEIERLERIMSRQQPGTALHRLNRDGELTEPPEELTEVVTHALEYSSITDGAFDVTVAPVLELYTTRFTRTGAPPAHHEVDAARERVGWQALRLDARGLAFEQPGMAVTLDGIAKGYVVDRAVDVLVRAGADRVMVSAGGDIAAAGGSSPLDTWRVSVQDPHLANGSLGVLRLHGEGVATSGDYMQAFTTDKRSHHIFDPRTGRSPDHTSGVTVIAPTAMDADALSTAVLVLGPVAGMALLNRLEGVEGMLVTKEGNVLRSAGLDRFSAGSDEYAVS